MQRITWFLLSIMCLTLSGCGTPSPAPLTTWPDQFQYVEAQITTQHPGYTVQRVTADEGFRNGNDTLRMRLEFADPNGNLVQVVYDDDNLQTTLRIDAGGYHKSTTLPQVGTITIHPRDVLTRTMDLRLAYQGTAPVDDIRWSMHLIEGKYTPGWEQIPVVWDVSYHLLFATTELHVYVDAHTGAILDQETKTW